MKISSWCDAKSISASSVGSPLAQKRTQNIIWHGLSFAITATVAMLSYPNTFPHTLMHFVRMCNLSSDSSDVPENRIKRKATAAA